MENVANTTPATTGGKKSLTERAFGELEKYAIIIVYLWLLFGLFSLHKQLVQGHGISLWHQGFAILNALIFGKVILIGQALKVGKGLERRELIWTVLGRSCCKAKLRQPTQDTLLSAGSSSSQSLGMSPMIPTSR